MEAEDQKIKDKWVTGLVFLGLQSYNLLEGLVIAELVSDIKDRGLLYRDPEPLFSTHDKIINVLVEDCKGHEKALEILNDCLAKVDDYGELKVCPDPETSLQPHS
ncbi:8820_t:CDS:2 [Diversispora eburnea]|uniref:8820_t:CDS:1 n=1 Tax=Diversispora eburnea TaxID=1213867 RepID=A0A9N8VWT9_9GLOM|nr:8820_t:CDS:2 [Diversispora eburnea]